MPLRGSQEQEKMKTEDRSGVADARAQTALTQRVGERLAPRPAKKHWWRGLRRSRNGSASA